MCKECTFEVIGSWLKVTGHAFWTSTSWDDKNRNRIHRYEGCIYHYFLLRTIHSAEIEVVKDIDDIKWLKIILYSCAPNSTSRQVDAFLLDPQELSLSTLENTILHSINPNK